MVPQQPIILADTIADNIFLETASFANPEIASFYKKWVARFPQQAQTQIGTPQGYSLSGGEKQVLNILRCLAADP
ncbi:hypothetical protein FC83_GL001399 [Agrilactobacillus composti DSM 18527 = JCM 14202]|uniref:ABC transporter domain-containing protein n=1 Tax=Agrilactobacillus composti DSM 18527 = JCM 14202 TaxID=1423734 RepID=X0PQ55_9LACO|nr:ABC transporter ATP-binding protein/permease [Agrilactobacillus composti]KRM30840.1 hypothetical protein FC83_GL001399 [Agrilactobacillus composti DSM 18527 = JCM 14202]GAF39842.1 hypothetical protein JCM14202_1718 [Agrilactobacillus composti DSM 18527 = JCM 14202]